MQVRSVCFKLLIVTVLLWGLDQECNAASLRVVPNRAQFFEYESVTFYCEGMSYCQLVRESKGKIHKFKNANKEEAAGLSHVIKTIYAEDSGKYWCDAGGGETSNSISITVAAGSVILEIPALPVTKGEAMTLRCRNKTTSSQLSADFYKDDVLINSSSTGNMTIHSVSRSYEGVYMCSVAGAGHSAGSQLTVTDRRSSSYTPWIIVAVLLGALLLVMGLHFTHKVSHLFTQRPRPDPAANQTVSGEDSAADTCTVTYAVMRTDRVQKGGDESSSRLVYYSLGLGDAQQLDPDLSDPSAGTDADLTEDHFYSTIH